MKDNRIQIRVTKEQKEMIQELADKDNRTISNYLINLAQREMINQAMTNIYGEGWDKNMNEDNKLREIAEEMFKNGWIICDDTNQIAREYGITKAQADRVHEMVGEILGEEEPLTINTHPEGNKLALYAGKVIIDWADYEDTDRIEAWKREYKI